MIDGELPEAGGKGRTCMEASSTMSRTIHHINAEHQVLVSSCLGLHSTLCKSRVRIICDGYGELLVWTMMTVISL